MYEYKVLTSQTKGVLNKIVNIIFGPKKERDLLCNSRLFKIT
jgi:hypothetical protein